MIVRDECIGRTTYAAPCGTPNAAVRCRYDAAVRGEAPCAASDHAWCATLVAGACSHAVKTDWLAAGQSLCEHQQGQQHARLKEPQTTVKPHRVAGARVCADIC
eukprot:SAG11_NODE_2598_length_3183_cov_4.460765_3_plen_104_part_00